MWGEGLPPQVQVLYRVGRPRLDIVILKRIAAPGGQTHAHTRRQLGSRETRDRRTCEGRRWRGLVGDGFVLRDCDHTRRNVGRTGMAINHDDGIGKWNSAATPRSRSTIRRLSGRRRRRENEIDGYGVGERRVVARSNQVEAIPYAIENEESGRIGSVARRDDRHRTADDLASRCASGSRAEAPSAPERSAAGYSVEPSVVFLAIHEMA